MTEARFYGILDLGYVELSQASQTARRLLAAGVDVLQLRAKAHQASDLLVLAGELGTACREAGVPFIVNDFPELAAEVGASGVHLGQEDGSLAEVRERFPALAILGRSTHSLEQACAAEREGADYIGFGPLHATPTKPGRAPIGLGDLATVHQRVRLPIFAIGGIKLDNLSQVAAAGAKRVVIVSELLQSGDPAAYIAQARARLGRS
ncbi:MAG: thiamine phosphate synthase [Verrucomicrobiota bacterium]